MSDYLTSTAFKTYAGMTTSSTVHDAEVTAAVTAASRAVDGYCQRAFTTASATGSRVFRAEWGHRIELDDFGSTTGLVVATDEADTGTYGQTWTFTTDYVVGPANARLNDLPWAYTELRAVGARYFPVIGQRNRVQVTAAWGWPATPAEIVQATTILALDLFKMKDSPFGVAGFSEFGVVRIRENTQLATLLQPYRRRRVLS